MLLSLYMRKTINMDTVFSFPPPTGSRRFATSPACQPRIGRFLSMVSTSGPCLQTPLAGTASEPRFFTTFRSGRRQCVTRFVTPRRTRRRYGTIAAPASTMSTTARGPATPLVSLEVARNRLCQLPQTACCCLFLLNELSLFSSSPYFVCCYRADRRRDSGGGLQAADHLPGRAPVGG